MVLSNYWKALKLATIFNGYDQPRYVDLGLVKINGYRSENILYSNEYRYQSMVQYNAKIRQFNGVRVGIGTGQIQPSDYCLFNDITSGIGNLEFEVIHSTLDNKFSSIINISGINNTGSERTITELGITKTFIINSDGTQGAPIMLAKLLLDRPVTVPANGAFAFTIEWDEA